MRMDLLYGRWPEEIARLTGVHLSTVRRWKRTGKHPPWLVPLLTMAFEGQLDPIAREWRGWILRGNKLVSPEGWAFTPGEIRCIPLMYGRIHDLGGDFPY